MPYLLHGYSLVSVFPISLKKQCVNITDFYLHGVRGEKIPRALKIKLIRFLWSRLAKFSQNG